MRHTRIIDVPSSWINDKLDDVALMAEVHKRPVVAVLEIGVDSFRAHKTNDPPYSGPKPGEKNRGLHAVTIVGYGRDEFLRPYWKCRNSWGPNWGENGYGRLKRAITKDEKSIFKEVGAFDM
ncbi:hypothetical protein Tsubulata_032613 [Turnera subulata]|uniref:Peptidase C1A papain C-terminal domain-containing protein n=1 Tax=Turnera subulata TaxID=218843 RepID=A0A9Q0F4A8_9ROSI|nr:hypothetical protein Tsubulata_032613 [Turnera subulata]